MNLKTLKPVASRPPEERRALASKAGRASGKKRRELKAVRDYMKALLSLPMENLEDAEALKAVGFNKSDLNRLADILITLAKKAKDGDTRAAELVLKIIGEYPSEKAEITTRDVSAPQVLTVRLVDLEGNKWIEHRTGDTILRLPDNGRDPNKWKVPTELVDE